jgi:uncharacterized membrane protein
MAGVAGSWSPTEAIGFGWNALTKNFVGVALPIAVAAIVAALPGQAITGLYAALATVVADLVEPSFIGILGYIVQGVSSLVGLFVGAFIAGGMASFSLKVARGQPASFGDVFSGGRYFGRMLVATLGFYVAFLIGLVLCVIPGYIVMLGLSMYTFLVVDQGLPGIDALKKSWEMTKGHKVNIFVYGLLAILVVIAGVLACGIGVLLGSYPVLMIGFSYIYLKIKGEQPQLAA